MRDSALDQSTCEGQKSREGEREIVMNMAILYSNSTRYTLAGITSGVFGDGESNSIAESQENK